jgi:hypothetical protein
LALFQRATVRRSICKRPQLHNDDAMQDFFASAYENRLSKGKLKKLQVGETAPSLTMIPADALRPISILRIAFVFSSLSRHTPLLDRPFLV